MSSSISTGFLDLPGEVRDRIYRYIFSGERLRHINYIQSIDRDYFFPICVEILFVSKRCYTESRPLLLESVEIDISELIDPYYNTINSLVLRPEMLKHVFISADGILRHLTDGKARLRNETFLPIRKCIVKLENLESLTFDCGERYAFEGGDMQFGWITESGVNFIQNNPHRIVGRDEDGPVETSHLIVRQLLIA